MRRWEKTLRSFPTGTDWTAGAMVKRWSKLASWKGFRWISYKFNIPIISWNPYQDAVMTIAHHMDLLDLSASVSKVMMQWRSLLMQPGVSQGPWVKGGGFHWSRFEKVDHQKIIRSPRLIHLNGESIGKICMQIHVKHLEYLVWNSAQNNIFRCFQCSVLWVWRFGTV